MSNAACCNPTYPSVPRNFRRFTTEFEPISIRENCSFHDGSLHRMHSGWIISSLFPLVSFTPLPFILSDTSDYRVVPSSAIWQNRTPMWESLTRLFIHYYDYGVSGDRSYSILCCLICTLGVGERLKYSMEVPGGTTSVTSPNTFLIPSMAVSNDGLGSHFISYMDQKRRKRKRNLNAATASNAVMAKTLHRRLVVTNSEEKSLSLSASVITVPAVSTELSTIYWRRIRP